MSSPPSPILAAYFAQALAAKPVALVTQAEWFPGVSPALSIPVRYEPVLPDQASGWPDGWPGQSPIHSSGGHVGNDRSWMGQHDLIVCRTRHGYRAVLLGSDHPGHDVYCSTPYFFIMIHPLPGLASALLPAYLLWWLNQTGPMDGGPEQLIQKMIPLPPMELQQRLVANLPPGALPLVFGISP
jgi:hypothetical protein